VDYNEELSMRKAQQTKFDLLYKINDSDETESGLDPIDPSDAQLDSDSDGLSNIDEINLYSTLIDNPDTDGDGMSDGAEVLADRDPLVFNESNPSSSAPVWPGTQSRFFP
jgi:hypothetical protein